MLLLCISEASLGDHVNVRRPFHSTDDVMSKSYHAGGDSRLGRRQAGPDLMSQSMMESEKSIEHSLALIRHHVKVSLPSHQWTDSLTVTMLAGPE